LLAHFARKKGVLETLPAPGDVFLLWSPRHQYFVRSGIIVSIEGTGFLRNLNLYYDCVTIEGDTDESMAVSGGRTLRHLRTLSSQGGDRFIRWRDIPIVREEGSERILTDGSVVRRRAA
jgi:hypothetical protein